MQKGRKMTYNENNQLKPIQDCQDVRISIEGHLNSYYNCSVNRHVEIQKI